MAKRTLLDKWLKSSVEAKPKPRNRQAVGKEIKAIILQNSRDSPLLRLPAEIRERIWRLAVGDRLVHLTSHSPHARKKGKPNEQIISYGLCRAHQTEDAAYQDFIGGSESVSNDDSSEYHSPTYRKRHIDCASIARYNFEKGELETFPPSRFDLRVLGVCRQIYEEAHLVLWSTNTFAFSYTMTLRALISRLNAAQRRKITSILLHSDFQDGLTEFTHLLKPSMLKPLTGLRTLKLRLDCEYYDTLDLVDNPKLKLFAPLRFIAWKEVKVIITDSVTGSREIQDFSLPLRKRRRLAEDLRSRLLETPPPRAPKSAFSSMG